MENGLSSDTYSTRLTENNTKRPLSVAGINQIAFYVTQLANCLPTSQRPEVICREGFPKDHLGNTETHLQAN